MSFQFLTDPEQAIFEQFCGARRYAGGRAHYAECKICKQNVSSTIDDKTGSKSYINHLRNAECIPFRESVRALRMADREGISICPLNEGTAAYKERCEQLAFYLRLAVDELDRLGSVVGRDARMRELAKQQTTSSRMTLTAVSTSAVTKQVSEAWSKVG